MDAVAKALGVDLIAAQAQLVDATALPALAEREPYAGGLLDLSPARPVLVGNVSSPALAGATQRALSRLYPADHEIAVVTSPAVPGQERVTMCRLSELARRPVQPGTSVWVPALASLAAYRSPATLLRIVARLRAPGGCPWDREQTHASLRDAVLEEAYEVADAIDTGDAAALTEELGDLLLLVAMQAQIAEEGGHFAFEDAVEHVTRKLIRRHPHVFGDVVARTPGEVIATWDGVKTRERQAKGNGEPPSEQHPLDRLPRAMPALQRVAALLRKEQQRAETTTMPADQAAIGNELLAAVERAAAAGVDPEAALLAAARRRLAVVAPDAS